MANSGLAQYSNVTLVLAILVYGLAMVAYAFDFAFTKRAAKAAVAPATAPSKAESPALVGAGADRAGLSFAADPGDPSELADLSEQDAGPAGGGAGDAASSAAATYLAGEQPRWPAGTWLRTAFALTCFGLLLQISSITARGIDEHRVPWGNMYEFIAAITCAAVLILTLAAIKFRAYYMGLFVLLPVVVALAVDVVVIYTPAGQLVPALQSYWIAIHVTAMIIAIGMYIFGAVVTVLYLISARVERRVAAGTARGGGIMSQLPGAAALDRLSYRSILFAFPAWTFAIIAGAIWADHAWGRYWGWDPKETWSFITWLVYAAFLHARATAGWRGRRAAVIHLVGFACLLFNLVGVNLWITGLHSYAGLPG
ncbi:MAG: c-type cytochrome biogenesis protein CcsB [Actinomycetota bacterium]|jgi:cytochrome c-type biogenesis protein CcsB|nr:c-type cytochrome biogenesis protein CcsB [Actinomycetota bacterium]